MAELPKEHLQLHRVEHTEHAEGVGMHAQRRKGALAICVGGCGDQLSGRKLGWQRGAKCLDGEKQVVLGLW